MSTGVNSFVPSAFDRAGRALLLWLTAFVVAGCSAIFIPPHDSASVERIDHISRSVLGFYQELFDLAPTQRKAALKSRLGKSQSDIESQMRLHLLREQARAKNTDSITVATNMLASWQRFSANHLGADATALSNDTLIAERELMERHLGSAFQAEEAKKLFGN